MFGVSNLISGQEFDPGWETDLGTLHMLRAYAKVRVRAHGDGLPITSVSLTRGNSRGYRAPLGVSRQDDYVHGSYARDYYRKPSVPADSEQLTDIPFIHSDNDDLWTLYLPEFANLGLDADGRPDPRAPLADDSRARIRVTFDGHVGYEYVDFKYYSAPPAYAGRMPAKAITSTCFATLYMTSFCANIREARRWMLKSTFSLMPSRCSVPVSDSCATRWATS